MPPQKGIFWMLIKLNVDTQELHDKPATFDGRLRNRLCSEASIRKIMPEQLMQAIIRGCSFTPAVMTGTTGDTWQSQQVVCADIDNDTGKKDAEGNKIRIAEPLSPDKAREVMAQHGIDPYFMYYSFSNADTWPKYRIVLILDEPITDPGTANDLTARFTGIFNAAVYHCADTTASDNARLYYGGKGDSIFYASGKTTSIATLQALPVYEDARLAETPKEAPRTPMEQKRVSTSQGGAYKPYSALQAQFEADKESFNLARYVEMTTNSRPVKRGRATFFNPCPICGHKDDFQVTGSLYHCFSSSGGTGGSIIDYLMHKEGLDTGAACEKFKFEIMGYDREEWRRAYKMEYYPNMVSDSARKLSVDAQNAYNVPDVQDVQKADPAQPVGLLTLERAKKILEAVDDHYLQMPNFPELSGMLKLRTHDTVVIAADTGAGKSSLCLNILHELQDRYPALYINLEMDEATVLQRLIAIHTGMELDRIEGYKHDVNTRSKVDAALGEILARKEIRLIADMYNIADIEMQIKAATRGRTEPTIVFVDTGLLVTLPNKSASRYERFTQISEELRRISRLNNVVMFVLLQQNREGKRKEDAEPTNSSLKESGSWENDATKIMFLWYNSKKETKELIITKNRNGKSGNVQLGYTPDTQTYSEFRRVDKTDNMPNFDNAPVT